MERTGRQFAVLVADALGDAYALVSITVAELLVGAGKAAPPDRRRRRLEFVSTVGAALPILPLDVPVAETLASLWADLASAGGGIGPYDVVGAATATVHGYDVVAFDVHEFARVPGLAVLRPDW